MADGKRMYVQADFLATAGERAAAQHLMRALDEEAAKHAREVSGEVSIAVSDTSALGMRTMRLEADTVSR